MGHGRDTAPLGGWVRHHRAGSTLGAFTLAAAGPVSAVTTGAEASVGQVVVLSAVGSVAVGLVADRLWPARLGLAILFGLPLLAAGNQFTAAWLILGLVVGDWVIRGRPPIPLVPALPVPALCIAALVYLCAMTTGPFRSGQLVATATLGAFAVCGLDLALRRRMALLSMMFAANLLGALMVRPDAPDIATAVAMVSAAASIWMLAVEGSRTDRWSLAANAGPLALAAGAALWWAVAVGTWASGVATSDQRGYRAFTVARSALPPAFTTILATAAVPVVMVALLGVGAELALRPRRVGRLVPAAVVAVTGGAALLASAWQWSIG